VAREKTGQKDRKHYSEEEWVDFVRNQLPQTQISAMQQHVDAGCTHCSAAANLWTRVDCMAARDASLEPPASAVRHVQQAFTALADSRHRKHLPLIPRLVFDSLWQPAFAGIRSGSGGSQRVIYKAGDVSIEMRLEPEPKSERITVAGQISIGLVQEQGFPAIPVIVASQTGSLASTTTNRFGEFHTAFVPERGLQIMFIITDEEPLVIPLESPGIRCG
jgi:hypothetical protein